MGAFKEGPRLLIQLVSCLVADVTRILSADLSCACVLVWGCISRPLLALAQVASEDTQTTPALPGEEQGQMQTYQGTNTADMQTLDSVQPEQGHDLESRRSWPGVRCSRLCFISHMATLAEAKPPPLAAFNFGFNLDCTFAFLRTGQCCPLLFDVVSQVPSATVNGKFALQTDR